MADEFEARRLNELASRAAKRGQAVYTHFLDPAQQEAARRAARAHDASAVFYGGYDDAERKVCAFVPSVMMEELLPQLDWPIARIIARWAAAYGKIEHRDLLGASLAIIQDRARFGDIIMCEGYALLLVLSAIADHCAGALTQAGRVTLKCAVASDVSHLIPATSGTVRQVRDTIASYRLDACVASAFGLSRAEAQSVIVSGRVKLNHTPQMNTDATVPPGGMISVRGMGRATLSETVGVNRRGRFSVVWICTG